VDQLHAAVDQAITRHGHNGNKNITMFGSGQSLLVTKEELGGRPWLERTARALSSLSEISEAALSSSVSQTRTLGTNEGACSMRRGIGHMPNAVTEILKRN
jgi:hypothetical protein